MGVAVTGGRGEDITEPIEDLDGRDQQGGTVVVQPGDDVAAPLAQPGGDGEPTPVIDDHTSPVLGGVRFDDEG